MPCPRLARSFSSLLLVGVFLLFFSAALQADGPQAAVPQADGPPTIAEKTQGLQAVEGLFTLYPDPRSGSLWMQLPAPGNDGNDGALSASVLYIEGLRTGLGSNPVGLDRGQINETQILDLRIMGPKVLFQARNLKFRADTTAAGERLATAESFAPAVLWAADVAAENEDGSVLIDIAPFLIRDAHGVEATLRNTGQGRYGLDAERSAVDFDELLAFPDNLELESLLTYALQSDEPGPLVAETAPMGKAFSLTQHISLVRLPDDGYEPRAADVRIGYFGEAFTDYAAALDESLRRRLIARHRLIKKDPSKARSEAVEPIVYYVDHGAPEPIRGALLDGARWWSEAFDAAGFIDGFQVKVLPEDVHPLDVRYNVIQWVHRSTRGWSYGNTVMDPRTGEIVKGHVSLGSLRVRQDRLIFEGLLGTAKTGSGEADDPIQLALARIRQLSAHEIGHTLGLTHNFAASTYGDRESVMDYPAPWVRPADDGGLDTSEAYGVGVGDWDVLSIRYGYAQPAPGQDTAALLDGIVREGLDKGILFLADDDARPPGAADPRASLWDNGRDAVDELESVLEVRRRALARFGTDNLPDGEPVAFLQEVLVPIYLYHRYQLDAAVKTVGGAEYHYAVKGDGQAPFTPISGERQRRALQVILELLDPRSLDLPDGLLDLLAPRPFRTRVNREMFVGSTGLSFDPLAAAAAAGDQVLAGLLHPERLTRMVDFHRRDASLPGPADVLGAVDKALFQGPAGEPPRLGEIRRQLQRLFLSRLQELSRHAELYAGARFEVDRYLEGLSDRLASGDAHGKWMAASIDRFFESPWQPTERALAPPQPPGSPIGQGLDDEGPRRLGYADCGFHPPQGH